MWVGWVHHSWRFGHAEALREVGPEMPERGSKTSTVRRLSNFWNFFSAIQMISCRARLVTIDENWLYDYDPVTKQQSMEWRHRGSLRPKKIPSAKIRWKSSHLDFLGLRRNPPHSLSSKGPNYQRGVLLIYAGAVGNFWGKTPREGHQGGLVLARQCPGSPGTCNPEETGLPGLQMSWPPTLFSGSGPVGLPPLPMTEKTIESSPFFVWRGGQCCRGDLVCHSTFWFFLVAYKS